MRSRLLVVVCACLLLSLVATPGCDDENQPRSRVQIVRIAASGTAIDLYSTPFYSDVLDSGNDGEPGTDDDAVYEDQLLVTVENQPSSSSLALDPEGAFGSVVLTGYRVEFDADGESIDPVVGSLHLVVPTGTKRIAAIVAVTAALKSQPPLSTLAATGGELPCSAQIIFSGYEETSEEDISATGTIQIHFADWLD
jgi:hypothetical protein